MIELPSYETVSVNQTYSLQLDHIPTVGYSAPFLSFFSALRFLFSGREIVEEGYHRVWS